LNEREAIARDGTKTKKRRDENQNKSEAGKNQIDTAYQTADETRIQEKD